MFLRALSAADAAALLSALAYRLLGLELQEAITIAAARVRLVTDILGRRFACLIVGIIDTVVIAKVERLLYCDDDSLISLLHNGQHTSIVRMKF